MAQSLAGTGRLLVRKIFLFQCASVIFSALIGMLIWDQNVAVAVLAGGVICILANLVFGLMAFKYAGASKNKQVVRSFNQGLKLKLFVSVILFVAVFQWLKLPALPLLAGYVITLMTQWPGIVYSSRGN
ncbi:ATP synthase subunit I [Neptunicella sp. SCSIO 80796]|uniref:ATP synthase subunit I n=1 Tax=Neptunicella plasticusilytica TaxID=3117012 RepID=UPI003A4DFC12